MDVVCVEAFMDRKPLGAQIKKARKQCGMTAERLAEACNMDTTYLRQIESGHKMPSLPMFVILCRELKASPAVLLEDYVPIPEYDERDRLHELYRTLTPEQRSLAAGLLESMKDSLTEE